MAVFPAPLLLSFNRFQPILITNKSEATVADTALTAKENRVPCIYKKKTNKTSYENCIKRPLNMTFELNLEIKTLLLLIISTFGKNNHSRK